MITLTQLEYVIALDTYRHFGEAAQACQVTQPTMSMQVKKLEDDLGVVLFDRSRQPIMPTEVGVAVVAQARQILAEAARLPEIVQSFQGRIEGSLHIGIIPTLAPYLLPLFIGDFARQYPDLQLHILELTTEDIRSRLKKDLLDVGILVTPVSEPGLQELVLFYEEIKIFVHAGHPLTTQHSVRAQDLDPSRMWMLSNGHCFRNQVLNLCGGPKQPANLPFRYESGSLETLKKIVEAEGGYTLLPELATASMAADEEAQVLSFDGIRPLREVSLLYSRRQSKQRVIAALADHIRRSVPPFMLRADRGAVVEWQ